MKTIEFYSSFSHKYNTQETEIHYYESRFVKSRNGKVICIDSAEEETEIGEVLSPEFRIELWAKETFKDRESIDLKLGMKKQIIHYCDETINVIEL